MLRGDSIRVIARRNAKNLVLFCVFLLLVSVVTVWNDAQKNQKEDPHVEKAGQRKTSRREIRDQLYFDFVDSTKGLDRVFNQVRRKRLPDVIGAGVKKCGTGAFKKLMMGHPMIRPISQEGQYFNRPTKKLEYYIELMPEVASYEIVLEETPGYFHDGSKDLPQKLWELLPTAKLYFVLCNPVNRTFSDFVQEDLHERFPGGTSYDVLMRELLHEVNLPKGNSSEIVDYIFSKRKTSRMTHLLTVGLYYHHILRFLEFYDRSQVFFVNGEDLITRPAEVIDEFQEFLGIPKLLIPEDFVRGPTGFSCVAPPVVKTDDNGRRKVVNLEPACLHSKNKGRTRLGNWGYVPDPKLIKDVCKFYAPHNEKLFKLIGRSFNWS